MKDRIRSFTALFLAALMALGMMGAASAEGGVIKIGVLTSFSGALQDYGNQMYEGFMLGLEYATNGTMTVAGKKIEVVTADTTTTPDVAREQCEKLLDEEKVDIVAGPASTSDALAILDLFLEFDKVIVIDPAAGDAIIGEGFNDHMFRTGRTSSMDAIAMAQVIKEIKEGATVATIAKDDSFGHSMIEPFNGYCEERGLTVVANEFCPGDTTDFSPYILRIKEAAPDYVYVVWSGANSPWPQLMEFDLAQYGINLITGAPEIASLKAMNYAVGMVGFCVYHWTLPRNEVNDWLVKRMNEEYGRVPDLFTPGGMAVAMAIVAALEKTGGDASAAALIPAMEGMRFNSPTGERYFRAEDHQAIQPLYAMELEAIEGLDYPQPKLIKELDAESIKPAIKAPNR